MQEITEQIYAEKVAQLTAALEVQRVLITALVFVAGKGKEVRISRGTQRQADKVIGEIEYRRLSNGEIRITITPPEEGPK